MIREYEKRIDALARFFGRNENAVGLIMPDGDKWKTNRGGILRVFRTKAAAREALSSCKTVIWIDV